MAKADRDVLEGKRYNWWKRPPKPDPFTDWEPTKTEQAHMSTKQLVARFKEAGMIYDQWKEENKW